MSNSKLKDSLMRQVSRLNREFELIGPGDRILVACSGGKDSWAMLHLLAAYRKKLPFSWSLVAVTLDQGQPGFDPRPLREHYAAYGFEHRIVFRDTYAVVVEQTPPGKIYCSLCSRMRRGILHRVADELGANKIALGHHRDDLIETLLLNMMFAGRLRAMAPILPPEGPGGHTLIRPLARCAEASLAAYTQQIGAPIVPCQLCGTQPNSQRQQVKNLLAQLEVQNPDIRRQLLAAAARIEPQHLLDSRYRGTNLGDLGDLGDPGVQSLTSTGQPDCASVRVSTRSLRRPD